MKHTQKPNYRIYDRTGGGVTEDIYAETLEDAIEQGRAWIEAGDWRDGNDDEDGARIYRTIELDCEVGEIVYRSDISSIEAVLPDYRIERDGETLYIEHHADDPASPVEITQRLANVAAVSIPADRDTEGYLRLVLLPVSPLPLEIDEEATDAAERHDCSGQYADELPECDADEDGEHDWQSDYEVVGGIRENPGVWSHGGTRTSFVECCAKCGCYKFTSDPGSQRNPGEALETITIRPRDEKSEAWLKEQHGEGGYIPDWLAEYLGEEGMRLTRSEMAYALRDAGDELEAQRVESGELSHEDAQSIYGELTNAA